MSVSPAEANRLAATIRAYWKRQGLSPAVRVEQEQVQASPTATGRTLWVVRSDMLGGMPRPASSPVTPSLSFNSGLTGNPHSPFAPLAAIRQRLEANESVLASKAVCGHHGAIAAIAAKMERYAADTVTDWAWSLGYPEAPRRPQ